jgi:hypothetical protein
MLLGFGSSWFLQDHLILRNSMMLYVYGKPWDIPKFRWFFEIIGKTCCFYWMMTLDFGQNTTVALGSIQNVGFMCSPAGKSIHFRFNSPQTKMNPWGLVIIRHKRDK